MNAKEKYEFGYDNFSKSYDRFSKNSIKLYVQFLSNLIKRRIKVTTQKLLSRYIRLTSALNINDRGRGAPKRILARICVNETVIRSGV